MHFLSEHDYDRKKVMSVLQGNQKSAVRFAFWKRLKELEKSISTRLQPIYKFNNGQHWNPNIRAQIHVICLHITLETVFRGNPQDQGKCSLNGSWAEVILFRNLLLWLFQSARKCIKKIMINLSLRCCVENSHKRSTSI